MAHVLLGLGANLGEPRLQLRQALAAIEPIVSLSAVSSVYLTEPVGGPDQPEYYNLVCRGETSLAPEELHGRLLAIEASLGRTRSVPDAPRKIDIDILAYEDRTISTASLTIPHPRMHQREFVLVPLAEIAPEWRHPVLGLTAAESLTRIERRRRVRRTDDLPDR